MSGSKSEKHDPQVAAHPDESNRDYGKAEPGAGLERRQARNAEQTEAAQGEPTQTGKKIKPDPMNP